MGPSALPVGVHAGGAVRVVDVDDVGCVGVVVAAVGVPGLPLAQGLTDALCLDVRGGQVAVQAVDLVTDPAQIVVQLFRVEAPSTGVESGAPELVRVQPVLLR